MTDQPIDIDLTALDSPVNDTQKYQAVYFGEVDQVIPWQIDHLFGSQTTCEKRLLKQW